MVVVGSILITVLADLGVIFTIAMLAVMIVPFVVDQLRDWRKR